MTTAREWTFGAHHAVFEQPDTLFVQFSGPTTFEDVNEALGVYAAAAKERSCFLLADIKTSSIDAKARKHLADNLDPAWFRGVVYVGAPLALKTITKALTVMVLFGAKSSYEIQFADTPDDGRRIIAKWRQTAA